MSRSPLAILGGKRSVPDGLERPWPQITDQEREAVERVLNRGSLWGHAAPEVSQLEREFADLLGTEYCLATNSGTAALHLAIAGVGVEPGDEVITTAVSWTSTATAILYHNAIPVFVDVEPETGNIDVEQIEAKITKRTRAVIPVHLHGLPVDMRGLRRVTDRHGLAVIEDASQAHGSKYHGAMVGTVGDAGVFSVHASKNLPGAGEGGLFVTSDEEVWRRAARVHQFGEERQSGPARAYDAVTVGWNYRMTELAAAFVRAQLTRLDETILHVRRNSHYLTAALSGGDAWRTPPEPEGRLHTFWRYTVRLIPKEAGSAVPIRRFAQRVRAALWAEGVRADLSDIVLPAMTLFQRRDGYGKGSPWTDGHHRGSVDYSKDLFPVALDRNDRIVSLGGRTPPNDSSLMDCYIEAMQKVHEQVDELMEASPESIMRHVASEAPFTFASGHAAFLRDIQ